MYHMIKFVIDKLTGHLYLRIIALREVRCTGYKAGMRQARSTYKILVGKPGAKHPLGRPKSRE